jgi:hypothetical protein
VSPAPDLPILHFLSDGAHRQFGLFNIFTVVRTPHSALCILHSALLQAPPNSCASRSALSPSKSPQPNEKGRGTLQPVPRPSPRYPKPKLKYQSSAPTRTHAGTAPDTPPG